MESCDKKFAMVVLALCTTILKLLIIDEMKCMKCQQQQQLNYNQVLQKLIIVSQR